MQALADRVNTSKAQIDKLERGERRLTVDWLQRLATGLECTIHDLIPTANNQPNPDSWLAAANYKKDLPLLGGVRGGTDGVFFDNGRVFEYVNRPPNLQGVVDAFAVYATGDSMEPRFYAGEILFVHPNRPLSRGCFVVIEFTDGRGLVKQFLRQDEKTLTVHQFNPDTDIVFRKNEVKHIFRVVGAAEAV